MLVGEVHAVGILLARDRPGEVLDLQVRLEQFDVQHLALRGVRAVRSHQVERQIAVVRLDESVHQQRIHVSHCALRPGGRLLGQCLSSSLPQAYAGPVLGVKPDQDTQAANFQGAHGQGRE